MVSLRQHGPSSIAQTLDHIHLPQGTTAIHRATDDASDLLGELVGSAGRCQADLSNMKVEIEVWVVDPIRMVKPERHLDDATPQWLQVPDERAKSFVHGGVRIEIR